MVLAVSSRALLDSCARLGVDTAAILAEAGIDRPTLDNPDTYLTFEKAAELWRRAFVASGDPELALHAAEALPFGAFRVIDFLGVSAPTVGAAFTHCAAYFPIINSRVQIPIAEERGGFTVGVVCPEQPSAITRPYVEFTFAAFFLRIRAATQTRFPLERVEMAFPTPPRITEHERIFESPVIFGAERNVMVISREAWETANVRADPNLFGLLMQHAQMLQQKIPNDPTPVREVREAILAQLGAETELSLERVAKQLAMSPRTLQRRLREYGLSYADLLDSTRSAAAKSYLADRQLAISEIAFLLGFAEQSSFNHAFKRWTGQTPKDYRRQHAPAMPAVRPIT